MEDAQHRRIVPGRLLTLVEIGGGKPGQKIDGIRFASTLFHSSPSVTCQFAFAESRSQKTWGRTKRYKYYNDGTYFDLSVDALEKHPPHDVAGRAADERKLLEAALAKLNVPENG